MTEILAAGVPALISAVVAIVTMISNRNTMKAEVAAMKNEVDQKQNEILQMTLRSNIQGIYSMYKGERRIPQIVYQGMCAMFDQYVKAGGNSYIKQLKAEVDGWERY